MNTLVQFILNLFGMGDRAKIVELVLGVLLGQKGQGTTTAPDPGAPTGGGSLASGALGVALGVLRERFKGKGLDGVFNSWVGTGANQSITPDQVRDGIGEDKLGEMARASGLSVDDLVAKLARHLPDVINNLTPGGKLPGE
ncbi:YidB family protein [Fimbriiglobus ruber]|uniref:DUF937 domain-containing protein n=1 Tax=Fimbriiglobus ruber TaxID=1908690 RepID=A0A225E5J1_9BACT|nr:YidB family protein [Fimbriiglobus ruber]OWK43945.1 hypothetical protein FRUB_03544 [Fimbriiglobus ruber]